MDALKAADEGRNGSESSTGIQRASGSVVKLLVVLGSHDVALRGGCRTHDRVRMSSGEGGSLTWQGQLGGRRRWLGDVARPAGGGECISR